MILEGIVTTLNVDVSPNISPMGPIVDAAMTRLTLRPYQTSTTYKNLKRTGQGVFHVTDDVEVLARAAIGRWNEPPRLLRATAVQGVILADACRWYAFRVVDLDDSQERTNIECDVADRGRIRDFFGFNRAKHAVLEAAILATRVELLPAEHIRHELQRLKVPVEKTAGDQERLAFHLLEEFIGDALGGVTPSP
jgi:hypothetical protein